jgi:hypothetical protein
MRGCLRPAIAEQYALGIENVAKLEQILCEHDDLLDLGADI